MTWKRPFINSKELFKAVMFAEKMLEKGDKTRLKAAEIAAGYYKVSMAEVIKYMNPELPELQATVDTPDQTPYLAPMSDDSLTRVTKVFAPELIEEETETEFEF